MSIIKVNKIENTATTDGGIEIDSTGHVKIDGQQLPTAGPLSNRNLIVNGAMQVAQRGTVVNAGNEYGGPDRYKFIKNDGAYTISQDTDAPSGSSFASSFKIDVTSAAGSIGNQHVFLRQMIEGQDLQQLKKGTSSAESFTLQFWVKSTKTGTYVVELYDADNNRQICKTYTVNSSNTWEYKTLTFAGDTTGAFDNDNAASLEINWWLYAGSTYTSGTLQTSWGVYSSAANAAVGQVNAADSTSNNILFTGIQLEVGEIATPFEHRSYGDELLKCQRYFYASLNSDETDEGYIMGHMWGTGGNAASVYGEVTFPVTMRREPDLIANVVGAGLRNYCENTAAWLSADTGSITAQQAGKSRFIVGLHNWNDGSGGTGGSAKYWTPGFGSWVEKYSASQRIDFNAEL